MAPPKAADGADVHWLDTTPPKVLPIGTTFGLPWAQGEIDRTTSLTAGNQTPLQSWPLAFWPDGTLKWTGHALSSSNASAPASFHIAPGTPTEPASPVKVTSDDSSIVVQTGSFTAKFNKSGDVLVDSLVLSGSSKLVEGKLIIYLQNQPDQDIPGPRPDVTSLQGSIDQVTVEQEGPVRAVIKITGKYTDGGSKSLFQFTVRFYVAAGSTALRMVHFFVYDGDQKQDFIKGIGLTFATPMTGLLQDRHVRFVSDSGGIWGEAIRTVSGLRRDATAAVLTPQFEGKKTPDLSAWPTTVSSEIDQLPVWSDFTLDQLNPNNFTISKRTIAGEQARWVNATGSLGKRSAGTGYVGGASGGGVLFGMKDFWQASPKGLDIRDAGKDTATVTLWAYSPRAPAMDMRHYDTVAHGLDLTYEDVGDPDPDPSGVGRSYDVTIQVVGSTPARADIATFGTTIATPPQLVASPEFYVSHNLFGGRWDVPSSANTGAKTIEKQKSDLLDFYVAEVEQRQWYGFWDYGDVMHTYDQTRHTWRYDVGGFAWDNGELGTDLWLWFSFLRTGRADIFRMAHALTRHLSESDTHHVGSYAGLGSRHNVSHWGDGAKEVRIAGAWLRRPFYFLTTDELMGDIMESTLQADETLLKWEPLRKVFPPVDTSIAPGRLRIGPDWVTLAGNWWCQWERTNDTKWRDRITTGMNDIAGFKFGMFTGNGAAVGWDPATAHLFDEGGAGEASYHLTMIFGGGEFLMEAMEVITDQPKFDSVWLDFCKFYNATDAEKLAKYGITFNSGGFGQLYAKLQAYAGQRLKDDSLKQKAWNILATNTVGVWPPVSKVGSTNVVTPLNEIQNLATNDAAQFSLSQYALLAIAPELAVPPPVVSNSSMPDPLGAACEQLEDNDTSTVVSDAAGKVEYNKGGSTSSARPMRRRGWTGFLCFR